MAAWHEASPLSSAPFFSLSRQQSCELFLPAGCERLWRQQAEQYQWRSVMSSTRGGSPASDIRPPCSGGVGRWRSWRKLPDRRPVSSPRSNATRGAAFSELRVSSDGGLRRHPSPLAVQGNVRHGGTLPFVKQKRSSSAAQTRPSPSPVRRTWWRVSLRHDATAAAASRGDNGGLRRAWHRQSETCVIFLQALEEAPRSTTCFFSSIERQREGRRLVSSELAAMVASSVTLLLWRCKATGDMAAHFLLLSRSGARQRHGLVRHLPPFDEHGGVFPSGTTRQRRQRAVVITEDSGEHGIGRARLASSSSKQ
nr:hypothetical protein Iba_chr13dCG6670 [Ipomoea batatas]